MIRIKHLRENGSVNGLLVATIALIFLSLIAVGVAVWSYINYDDQKTNVDTKIASAVAIADKKRADIDEENFFKREKEPNREFVGPDDYGRVTFDYPKTWSVYVSKDASKGGVFEAYLNPITVPPISTSQQFALRVVIESEDYDRAIAGYSSLVKKGDLVASSVVADKNSGTRLDGSFSKDIRGSAVIFKIRDKTFTLRSDANTFKVDFDNIIKTIKFNE